MKKSIFAIKRRSSGLLSKLSHTTALIFLRRDFFSTGVSPSLEEEDPTGDSDAETTVGWSFESFMVRIAGKKHRQYKSRKERCLLIQNLLRLPIQLHTEAEAGI